MSKQSQNEQSESLENSQQKITSKLDSSESVNPSQVPIRNSNEVVRNPNNAQQQANSNKTQDTQTANSTVIASNTTTTSAAAALPTVITTQTVSNLMLNSSPQINNTHVSPSPNPLKLYSSLIEKEIK